MPQHEKHYPRLGELITRLVRTLAATKGWKITFAMTYIGEQTFYGPDMVHHWRQGKSLPKRETLEILAKIGKEDADLEREWGESLLRSAYHPDVTRVVNKLWGPKVIRSIPCNLPSRDRSQLIGRRAEIEHLLKLLSPDIGTALITVDGIGGVGKTTLVLEVADLCRRVSVGEESDSKTPHFDAIIFVSAKQQRLMPDGILPSSEAKRTLRDIFREIASTLEYSEITYTAPHEQISIVHKALRRQTTLLIVDNLETMEDKQEILSFLYELPRSVKVVVTTRERVLFSPIHLDELSQEEALTLIEEERGEKKVELSQLSETQSLCLYRHIGGVPAALVYAIGQIAIGYSVETILERIPRTDGDVARFCFEGSVGPLRGQPAHFLLMALAMFTKPPLQITLVHVAGLTADQAAVEEGLTQLRRLSLIKYREQRYEMLPLTREYALFELAAHPSFEQEARLRWVEWYESYMQEYGGEDMKDWNERYSKIEDEWENLLTVFGWCAAHGHYESIQTFWQVRHFDRFAHIYGYWDDRITWLGWIIQAAEKRGDWLHAIKAMVDIGFTFTLMSQLEEADRYLQRAWEKHSYADLRSQLILIQKITNLHIQKNEYITANSWLYRAEEILKTIEGSLEEPDRSRRLIDFQSNRGLIFYKQKDFSQAEVCYQEAVKLAKSIEWQRAITYAQNYLASIAIAQDRLEEAEALLRTSLPVDKDRRLGAFHKLTSAYLYQKKGDMGQAYHLAGKARDAFERLHMIQEVREADELLQQLQS